MGPQEAGPARAGLFVFGVGKSNYVGIGFITIWYKMEVVILGKLLLHLEC